MKTNLSQENLHYMNNTINNNNNINNKALLGDISKVDLINNNNIITLCNKKNSDKINQSIDKLITDSEENKMKIETLNSKLKSLQFEKKYFELM